MVKVAVAVVLVVFAVAFVVQQAGAVVSTYFATILGR